MPILSDKNQRKRAVNYAVKIGITALLLFLILRSVNSRDTAAAMSGVSFQSLLIALLLLFCSTTIASFRWYLIMQRIGFCQGYLFFLKSYFKGAFFNQGLPTSVGGDGLRILDCSRSLKNGQKRGEPGSAEDAFFGVFIDRIIGLAGLLLLNISALLLNHTLLPATVYYPLLFILSCLTCGLIALFFLRKFRIFTTGRYLGYLGRLSERYFQVYSSIRSISIQLGLSIITHLCAMSAFYVLGRATGLDFPLQVYLVLVPPVILLTLVPISLAGWGVREGAMVGFFLMIGADKSRVLTFSILFGLTAMVASLPGLMVYLTQKNKL